MMADIPPDFNSGAAGTEHQTLQALRGLGHEVDVLWGDSFPHRIRHWNLHYLFELPPAYRKVMRRELSREEYDVVHVNQPYGYLAARALRRSPIHSVFIHRSHGFELRVAGELRPWRETYEKDRRPIFKKLASKLVTHAVSHSCRSIARYADGHIVSASPCRNFLTEQLQVPIERIAVIPQAASDSFLEEPTPIMKPDRLKHILYVGQFAFFKAPMIVAEVINQLSAREGELRFTWVCSKEHHAQVKEMLTGEARDRLQLLDWMPQYDLMRVYDSHGIFLFPSFVEGFGKVFLEAMSRGLCIVAADNGGAHDVITNEVDGVLTPTGDIKAMTDTCLRLLDSAEKAIRMSSAAAVTARAYTWDRVARETVAFYENRIEARAGRPSI